MPPPEMGVSARGPFPGLLSAGEMCDPHLIPGQGDLLLETVVAELHVPARVERRDRAFADEVQGILVAIPSRRFEDYLFEPVQYRLAAETLQIHDQHAGVDVAVPFREAPFGRPGNIFGLCGVNHVFRGGEIVVVNICRIQLAEVAAHGDVHVYVHDLVVCGEDAWQKQPVARRQRQPGRLFVARKPGCHKFIRNIDESHGRMAGPGVSGDERPDRIFRDARVQDYDVQVASGRVRNRRVYCDFEIRQIILVRREHYGHVPRGKGRLDVRARKRLHRLCIQPSRRRRGPSTRLEPLLQLRDTHLFRFQGCEARHEGVIDKLGNPVVCGNILQNAVPTFLLRRFESYRSQVPEGRAIHRTHTAAEEIHFNASLRKMRLREFPYQPSRRHASAQMIDGVVPRCHDRPLAEPPVIILFTHGHDPARNSVQGRGKKLVFVNHARREPDCAFDQKIAVDQP